MRKYSKAMKRRVADLTNLIFRDAVREVTGIKDENDEDLAVTIDLIRHTNSLYLEEELDEVRKIKEEVDNLYLEKMISLQTKQLEEIVTVHHEGAIRRATRTMEALLSELTRRSMLGDSKESDNRYNYGDVYGHKTKSKRGRKKVASKGRKSSKN